MSDLKWEIMCGKQKTVADAQNAHKTELGEAKSLGGICCDHYFAIRMPP